MSRVVEIGGQPVARDTPVWELASRLSAKDGAIVVLGIARPDGRQVPLRIAASNNPREQAARAAPIERGTRLILRMIFAVLACITLIACAVLLFCAGRMTRGLVFHSAFCVASSSTAGAAGWRGRGGFSTLSVDRLARGGIGSRFFPTAGSISPGR